MPRELPDSDEYLRRVDRLAAVGEVAAGLAHEIRNPLAAIKGALEIVASRVPPDSPEAEFTEIGRKELARLEELVEEFLLYARPHDPKLRPADIHEVTDRVALLVAPEAARNGVTIKFERPATLPQVPIDSELITQAISNVVRNAIQATQAQGDVCIRESLDPGWLVIDVLDHGRGIAPEHAPRIFDPFFTTKSRGTGLGLAVTQRIVFAHHGTVEAFPGSPSGTLFRIRLPLG